MTVILLLIIIITKSCKTQDLPALYGDIGGIVKDDKTGEAIKNAQVSVTTNDGQVNQVLTPETGLYVFKRLDAGDYKLIAEHSDYETSNQIIKVLAGEVSNFDFSLRKSINSQNPEEQVAIELNSLIAKETSIEIKGTLTGKNFTEFGVVFSKENNNPTLIDSKKIVGVRGTDNVFTSIIENLLPNTKYYLRAYAQNSTSTFYSSVASEQTKPLSPASISSFSPIKAGVGDKVELKGVNFGLDSSLIRVYFTNKRAKLLEYSDQRLVVEVPEGAPYGKVKVEKIDGNTAESNQLFTYVLTPYVTTLSQSLENRIGYYINDISAAGDGELLACGYQVSINPVSTNPTKYGLYNSVIYQVSKDNTVNKLIDKEAAYNNGSLAQAKFVSPTEVVYVNGVTYVADQFDNNQHVASGLNESFISIRSVGNSEVKELVRTNWLDTKEDFIHDMLYLPQRNGILFSKGTFELYNLNSNSDKTEKLLEYDGLSVFLAAAQNDVYTLELSPVASPTKWFLNKRSVNNLASIQEIVSGNLLEKDTYPVGFSVDPNRNIAYLVEKNKVGSHHRIYTVDLITKMVDIIYENSSNGSQRDGEISIDGSNAKFNSISCITFDTSRNALVVVDVHTNGSSRLRLLEFK